MSIRDKRIGSFHSRSTCSSIVLATWNSTLSGPMPPSVENIEQNLGDSNPVEITRAARIESTFVHTMTFNRLYAIDAYKRQYVKPR